MKTKLFWTLALLLCAIGLVSCSKDEPVKVNLNSQLPLGEYVYLDPVTTKSSIYFYPKNSSLYKEGELKGNCYIRGIRGYSGSVVANPDPFSNAKFDGQYLTIELGNEYYSGFYATLIFKFAEYPDRYELAYVKGESNQPNRLQYLPQMVFVQHK